MLAKKVKSRVVSNIVCNILKPTIQQSSPLHPATGQVWKVCPVSRALLCHSSEWQRRVVFIAKLVYTTKAFALECWCIHSRENKKVKSKWSAGVSSHNYFQFLCAQLCATTTDALEEHLYTHLGNYRVLPPPYWQTFRPAFWMCHFKQLQTLSPSDVFGRHIIAACCWK